MAKRASVPSPDAEEPIDALSAASCRLTVALKLLIEHHCPDTLDDTRPDYDGGAGLVVACDLVQGVRDMVRASFQAAQTKAGA